MKITFIIYGVSWLILLAIYLYRRKENTFKWNEADGVEKFALIFVVLLAPIVVLFIPFMLFSQVRDKKKSQKVTEARERQEREEQEYRTNALAAMHQAKANRTQKDISDFKQFLSSARSSYSTNFYTHMQDENNYPLIMTILHKLSLPEGASLLVEKCKQQGLGDRSKLFIETPKGAYDYNIWDYISVEKSSEGAWNAYLLYNLWHVLPMFWHALYDRRYYLFFPEFTDFIECLQKDDTQTLRKVLKQHVTSPDVIYANGKFYVSCCYFTNFGGLIQETVEITIYNGKASFHSIEQKTLFEYNCGIMF